jgi:hypothetical protein
LAVCPVYLDSEFVNFSSVVQHRDIVAFADKLRHAPTDVRTLAITVVIGDAQLYGHVSNRASLETLLHDDRVLAKASPPFPDTKVHISKVLGSLANEPMNASECGAIAFFPDAEDRRVIEDMAH